MEQLDPFEDEEDASTASSAIAQYQDLMARHNETHAGMHFGLPRLCLHLHGAGRRRSHTVRSLRRLNSFRQAQSQAAAEADELLAGAFSGGLPLQPIWVQWEEGRGEGERRQRDTSTPLLAIHAPRAARAPQPAPGASRAWA